MSKIIGYIGGLILIIIGIIIVISGFSGFLHFGYTLAMGTISGFSSGAMPLIYIFLGGILIVLGIYILYFTSLGKVYSYVAKETAPVVETVSNTVSKGWQSEKVVTKKSALKNKKNSKTRTKKTKAKL